MLPLEICTLILLASNALANPQPQKVDVANSTITSAPTPTFLTSQAAAHDESTAMGFESTKRGTRSLKGGPGIESTETGWETIGGPPQSSRTPGVGRPNPPDVIITTETPIVIDISTYIQDPKPSAGPNGPGPNNPGAGGDGGTQPPENNQNNPGGGQAPTGPEPPIAQTTPGSELLTEIIRRIGSPQPGAQPTYQPAVPTNRNAETMPGFENIQPTSPSGESPAITLSGAALTLTPGLITTVGAGDEATAVSITTNAAGQTIIVVSSSGTAVSATMTKTAVTMTAPKSGFDAEVTAQASPGGHGGDSSDGAVASTSSKGDAWVHRSLEAEWLLSILAGISALL